MGSKMATVEKPKVIKLIYFDLRARAEAIRVNLAYAGIKYDDVRLTPPFVEGSTWPQVKPKTPFGQLPVLEVDGHTISQSQAIARYVAKLTGIHGKTAIEQARYDSIAGACQDMFEKWVLWAFESDEKKKEEKGKQITIKLAELFTNLTNILGKAKFFGGSQLSWADLQVFHITEVFSIAGFGAVIEQHSAISGLAKRVAQIPNIKKYLSDRKHTDA